MSVQQRITINEHTRYAGFWRRVGASIIDSIIIIPVLGIILYLIYGPGYFHWYTSPHGFLEFYGSGDALINELLPILLIIFFWVKFLGTPGKLLLSCHIVHAQTGEPLTTGRALLRYLGYYLSMLPLMLGFMWVGWDKRKQGFHDKIANSVVVIYDEASEPLEDLHTDYRELR